MKTLPYLFLLALVGFCISCDKINTPVVKTVAFEIITLNSALLTGEVTSESEEAVTKRGFYWGTNPNPGLTDNSSDNQVGSGVFTERIGKLDYGQEYYFRSYAVTATGTLLGEVLLFKIEIKPVTGTITDSRDGKVYSTVKIINQTWLAENLAYLPAVSPSSNAAVTSPSYYVYDYEGSDVAAAKATTNYNTYGVLYNWAAANNACPSGWHLATDTEWDILTDYLAISAGGFMKEAGTTHWESPNTGATNASGFTVLPGGACVYNGGFGGLGTHASFWSSTENGWFAFYRELVFNYDGRIRGLEYCGRGYSVRCIKDR
jgi:uncharacterized protein (TIGR02145 family)